MNSTGILFIRWNHHNKVAVAVSYFEDDKMVYMKVDKTKMRKLVSLFLPNTVDYEFISQIPLLFKRKKISELQWNIEAEKQNGIIEVQKTNPISIKVSRYKFNQLCKMYLK